MGFQDFAGSTIVHSTGGWAALVVGPRLGKFRSDGSVKPTPPSNVPVVTLGVFILWLGWFGFNGGSQLALGSALDAVAMSQVLVNTNLAAAGGVLAVGAFVFGLSWLAWLALAKTLGARVELDVEQLGRDAAELGIEAYPEFVLMPDMEE